MQAVSIPAGPWPPPSAIDGPACKQGPSWPWSRSGSGTSGSDLHDGDLSSHSQWLSPENLGSSIGRLGPPLPKCSDNGRDC